MKIIKYILLLFPLLALADNEYNAHITDVYDGDTVTANVFLGLNTSVYGKFRLYGINAPEVRGVSKPEGLKARDWLRQRILDKDVILKVTSKRKKAYGRNFDKKGKYGRYIASIYIDGVNVNKELVDNGFAVYKVY